MSAPERSLQRSVGTWQVFVAGVALVVAASTLVSDLAGFFSLGAGFVVALAIAFVVNLALALSVARLAARHPRAGGLYEYARSVIGGTMGRVVGTALGLAFFGMFAFAAAGETTAGAHGLRALVGDGVPFWALIVALNALALIPNLLGLRTASWVGAVLLVVMIGIRWAFGAAGFLGLGIEPWSVANLDTGAPLSLFGDAGIVTTGLALAIWTFVGIEFAASLAEEARDPRRSISRGMVLGLVAILLTSLVMGLGVAGSAPIETWRAVSAGSGGAGGDAPQLAVGATMFGEAGRILMALASVAATLGTLTVAYAAMPRILFGIARDGALTPRTSRVLARIDPRTGGPTAAILVTLPVYLVPALIGGAVVEWVYAAAYLWLVLYGVFHLLALFDAREVRAGRGARLQRTVAMAGLGLTAATILFSFDGSHGEYGLRAAVVLASAGALAIVPALAQRVRVSRSAFSDVASALDEPPPLAREPT